MDAEIVGDGSEIRSLAGRTARLADGFSRNCGNRDELLEARTKDLVDRCGKVRSFNLKQYLSDCELPDSVQTWGVGDDAYISARDADTAAMLSEEPGHWPHRSIFQTGEEEIIGSTRSYGNRVDHQDF